MTIRDELLALRQQVESLTAENVQLKQRIVADEAATMRNVYPAWLLTEPFDQIAQIVRDIPVEQLEWLLHGSNGDVDDKWFEVDAWLERVKATLSLSAQLTQGAS